MKATLILSAFVVHFVISTASFAQTLFGPTTFGNGSQIITIPAPAGNTPTGSNHGYYVPRADQGYVPRRLRQHHAQTKPHR
jgi:hypothetical protein